MAPLLALAPRETALAGPAGGWRLCQPDTLGALLAAEAWSLVEFWTPHCVFSRLLAPVRAGLASSHGDRVRLLCCADAVFGPGFTGFGVTAMPAVLLFQRSRRMRRWLGATDLSLMRFELDRAMQDGEAGHGA